MAGEVQGGISQGGLRMEPLQGCQKSDCGWLSSLWCEWGKRRRMLKHLYRTASWRTEVLASQLQVAVEHIIWDPKPEASLQAPLLIC